VADLPAKAPVNEFGCIDCQPETFTNSWPAWLIASVILGLVGWMVLRFLLFLWRELQSESSEARDEK